MRFSNSLGIASLLLMGVILTACSTAQPSSTNTGISITQPTSTATSIVSSTTPPTPTVIPTLTIPTGDQSLGDRPEAISPDDIVVVNGDYLFQITSASLRPEIGNVAPNTGEQFLVIEGYLRNYSEHEQNFYMQDFALRLNDSENVFPDNYLMGILKEQSDAPDADYPGDNTLRTHSFSVSVDRAKSAFLVYRLLENSSWISLEFMPDGRLPTSIEFMMISGDNNGFELLKTRDNGEPLYQITNISFGEERITSILNIRSERLENCSDIEIPTDFTLGSTTSEMQSTRLGTNSSVDLMGVPLPLLHTLVALRSGSYSESAQATSLGSERRC